MRRRIDSEHVQHEPAGDTDQGQERKQPRRHTDRVAAAVADGIRSNADDRDDKPAVSRSLGELPQPRPVVPREARLALLDELGRHVVELSAEPG
jgi:hypothetical protein